MSTCDGLSSPTGSPPGAQSSATHGTAPKSGSPAACAAGDPDFGAVPWVALDCAPGGAPVGDESPSQVDIVGDAAYPATYYAYDAKYLYFRYRLDTNPVSKGGYAEGIWSALMQV